MAPYAGAHGLASATPEMAARVATAIFRGEFLAGGRIGPALPGGTLAAVLARQQQRRRRRGLPTWVRRPTSYSNRYS